MKTIGIKILVDYCTKEGKGDAKIAITSWIKIVQNANWRSPLDIKSQWPKASIIAHNRVVFNIAGNKHRLIVKVNYEAKVVIVRFVGTHAEYNRIDAASV